MTYDLTLERLIDAPPEVVFDIVVDPEAQPEIFAGQVPGWELWEHEIDLRVGGSWSFAFGRADRSGEPDRSTSVFTEVDRPHRLAYEVSMSLGEWGRTINLTETITFEDRDGKTLVTIRLSGLGTEAERDAFMGGVPGYLDAIERVVPARIAGRSA